jgi:hypothetical protein
VPHNRSLACGLIILGALLLLAAVIGDARADGDFVNEPPEKRAWFAKQRNLIGAYCCDNTEAHSVGDWRQTEHGWTVTLNGQDIEVKPEAIVNGSNPYGVGVLWIYPKGAPPSRESARCFLKGMEG